MLAGFHFVNFNFIVIHATHKKTIVITARHISYAYSNTRMKSTVAIPKRILRLHDNPLFVPDLAHVVFLIDTRRIPKQRPEMRTIGSNAMSIPQSLLYFEAMHRHAKEVAARGISVEIVATDKVAHYLKSLSKHYSRCITDNAHEPVFDEWDVALTSTFGPRNMTVCDTMTLCPWQQPAIILSKARGTFAKSSFGGRKKLKAFIHQHLRPLHPAPRKKSPSNDAIGLLLLQRIIQSVQALARKCKIETYPIDQLTGTSLNFDKCIVSVARKASRLISDPRWRKPRTARNLSLLERTDGLYNTSKMSPLLSLGILSPRYFYDLLLDTNKTMPTVGDGADQLLFRECWYAAAAADSTRTAFWSNTPGWWKEANYVQRPTKKELSQPWNAAPRSVWHWARADMKEEWVDANESMRLLRNTGWIHHLRRHLVADVLCRGKLKQHFLYGELWFRATLLDHDSVVNRANWLWLSAQGFSSKQHVYHYSPKDYIQRGTRKRKTPSIVKSLACAES